MEFELDFRENQAVAIITGFLSLALLLFSSAQIGKPLTPYTGETAQVLSWADWTLHKAEKIYIEERDLLRKDAESLDQALESKSDPVSVSLLIKQIEEHISEGTPALSPARAALAQAALDTGDWSIGILEREKALGSLGIAIALLSE